jgi:hypothetical protein
MWEALQYLFLKLKGTKNTDPRTVRYKNDHHLISGEVDDRQSIDQHIFL